MKKYIQLIRKMFLYLLFILLIPLNAFGTSIYTFEGTANTVNDAAGIINGTIQQGAPLFYVILLDFDRIGQYQTNNGEIITNVKHYYAEFRDGSVVHKKDNGWYTAPDDVAYWNTAWEDSGYGSIFSLPMNEILNIYKHAPISSWEVGTAVNGWKKFGMRMEIILKLDLA